MFLIAGCPGGREDGDGTFVGAASKRQPEGRK
jgi:hypothetical protein